MNMAPEEQHDCASFLRSGLAEALLAGAASHPWSTCRSCSEHVSAARALLPALQQQPRLPAELDHPEFLEQVQERIVLHAEQTQAGQLLAGALKVPPPEPPQELRPGVSLDGGLAQFVRSLPAEPSDEAWARLRSQVWLQVRRRDAATSLSSARLAFAGIAAAALFMTFLPHERNTAVPTIVFTDVATIPGSEFSPMSILRGR